MAALADSLPSLRERDVVVMSSKVVSINEGRCQSVVGSDKQALALTLADIVIPRPYWGSPITVVQHALIGLSGIDESNGNGYWVLHPEDPFRSARDLHRQLCDTYGITTLGVIISDSRSDLFRYGATGVAIGWWGVRPLRDHRGETDLFGRMIKSERSNIVDGLAAAATILMGEVARQTPVVIVRDVPELEFSNESTREEIFAPYKEDKFRVLYEGFIGDGTAR